MKRLGIMLMVLILGASATAIAAEVPGGAKIVRIDDGAASTCIDISRHKISLHLRRILVSKDIGWFSEDKEIGIVMNTVVSGVSSSAPQKVKFPRMFKATVAEYGEGVVSVPIEIKLFNRFILTQGQSQFDGVELDFVVLKKKKKTAFGAGLSALATLSESLPLPVNPYTEGFKYFAKFANDVLDNSLNEANNVDETVREGQIVFSFSENGVCGSDMEYTGTTVVIKGYEGTEQDGYVDINKEYCWRVKRRYSLELKFSNLPPNGNCEELKDSDFATVMNPYYAFVLNASPPPPVAGKEKTERIDLIGLGSRGKVELGKLGESELKEVVASRFGTDLNATERNIIANKVAVELSKPRNPDPTATFLTPEGNLIQWSTNRTDSFVFDIAESLRRCRFHGIPIDECL